MTRVGSQSHKKKIVLGNANYVAPGWFTSLQLRVTPFHVHTFATLPTPTIPTSGMFKRYKANNRGKGGQTCTPFLLTHCGRVKQICVFNTMKLGTSASSP